MNMVIFEAYYLARTGLDAGRTADAIGVHNKREIVDKLFGEFYHRLRD